MEKKGKKGEKKRKVGEKMKKCKKSERGMHCGLLLQSTMHLSVGKQWFQKIKSTNIILKHEKIK